MNLKLALRAVAASASVKMRSSDRVEALIQGTISQALRALADTIENQEHQLGAPRPTEERLADLERDVRMLGLAGNRVVRSDGPGPITKILINGEAKSVRTGFISYEDLVQMADMEGSPSVKWNTWDASGVLPPHHSIFSLPLTEFTVYW